MAGGSSAFHGARFNSTQNSCTFVIKRQPPHEHKTSNLPKRTIKVLAGDNATYAAPKVPEISGSPSILVLGGTGRVGSSTAASLINHIPNASISLASRNKESYEEAIARRPELKNTGRVSVDINNASSLLSALKGADLVIHTAGPFQQKASCDVLEAAIASGVPYLDVCDDTSYSLRAKKLHDKAVAAGVPAIITAGIYPGVSNVMAAHMISIGRREYSDAFEYIPLPDDARESVSQPQRVLYSYFTAGSGGAGPTILKTTFLLAGEEVVAYKDGTAVTLPPVSNRRVVDFGPGIGRQGVFLYSLPEVESTHRILGVPSVSARFGTSPDIWNWAMWLVARIVPQSVLQSPDAVAGLASLVDPLVRAVDAAVGEKVGMLVEVEFDDGKAAAGLFVHNKLSESVGISTAAFSRCMLAGHTRAGVWFPEEKDALKDRRALLQMSSEGCSRFVLNRSKWALESEPVQLGLGFYW